jgi:hypothetical protein
MERQRYSSLSRKALFWFALGIAISQVAPAFTAYMPSFFAVANNLSEGNAATIRANIGAAPTSTYTKYTTANAAYTFGATNMETVGLAQTVTFASTVNLPTSPTTGEIKCLKDAGNNFVTHPATVKTTDSSTIDQVAGATGYVMNQAGQHNCFQFDGAANWSVE